MSFFGADHAPGSAGRLAADVVRDGRADAWATLRALLTVRLPAPIPPEVDQELDQLSDSQAARRVTIEADDLPVLNATHVCPALSVNTWVSGAAI